MMENREILLGKTLNSALSAAPVGERKSLTRMSLMYADLSKL